MIKNVFSEFEENNWVEIARGNIYSQALSACLAESQFKGCAAEQTLRFRATGPTTVEASETRGTTALVY
jgi:hypothetical protein